VSKLKAFVLVRGESGRLYLYDRETWDYMGGNKFNTPAFDFVVDSDDPEELTRMQALVNKDIKVEK
jgi:hypothetical protein